MIIETSASIEVNLIHIRIECHIMNRFECRLALKTEHIEQVKSLTMLS